MGKLRTLLADIRGFFTEVVVEMKKCTWPERQELVESTTVVIVLVLVLSAFVGVSDKLLVLLLKLIVPTG